MKLNNIKTGLLLAGLLLLFGNVKAQDNPFKPDWFVSGGINGGHSFKWFGKQHIGRESLRRRVVK